MFGHRTLRGVKQTDLCQEADFLGLLHTTRVQWPTAMSFGPGQAAGESRGAHQRLDYPETDPQWQRHEELSIADWQG